MLWSSFALLIVYGLKPKVWGRVGPDPRAALQVDPAWGPQARVSRQNKILELDLLPRDQLWEKAVDWTLNFCSNGPPYRRPKGRVYGLTWFLLVFFKWDKGNTSLCVASPEQMNSHSSGVSYRDEQGYNNLLRLASYMYNSYNPYISTQFPSRNPYSKFAGISAIDRHCFYTWCIVKTIEKSVQN